MATTTKLTKAQLLARIDEVEAACAAEIRATDERAHSISEQLQAEREHSAALQRECDALYAAQRPSRATTITAQSTAKVVYLRGVPHYKLRAWEHGHLITTYRAVA